jgi:hypothetical protein
MAIVTVHHAKTQLSKLIARAEAGEEIPDAFFFDPLPEDELKLFEAADEEAPAR